jgi:hypothetical protein
VSIFRDAQGEEWQVQFDAFNLADTKKETGIDLADISAGGWHAIEVDATAVGKTLAIVCGDEIRARKLTGRDFAKRVRGDAIERGRQALLAEGADFFPQSEWSAIRANSRKRTKMAEGQVGAQMIGDLATFREMAEIFKGLPPAIQEKLILSGGDTSSLLSDSNESASGQIVIPSLAATDLQANSELTAVS